MIEAEQRVDRPSSENGAVRRAEELERLEEWTGLDPQGRSARAAELELAAAGDGDTHAVMRARLVQADAAERAGELKAAAAVMWQVNEWAYGNGDRFLIARSHLLLGRTYRNMGDVVTLLEHMVSAVEHLDETLAPQRRLPYVVKYADALCENGSIELARVRYQQAAELARHSTEVRDEIHVLNNSAYAEFQAGDFERAWTLVCRMKEVAAARGHRLDPNDLDTIASVQIALGHYAEAEQTVLSGIAGYGNGVKEADALPEFYLTLAVARRLQDDVAGAQAALDECGELCEAHGHVEIHVRCRQEQAELYALKADFEQAFAEYKRFHAAEKELQSAHRAAQALTRQALFEVNEAREQAERFREQARRDALTGLPNRRYVNEQLPSLITQAARTGDKLWVALADLDHFKQVNDCCSHETGDQVLVTVGRLLSDAVDGFVARLGGEEFLIVLSGDDVAGRLDAARLAVAGHPWRPLTGDLPVTVSIGGAAAVPGIDQATLIAQADEQLYAAKRAGRNRVRLP